MNLAFGDTRVVVALLLVLGAQASAAPPGSKQVARPDKPFTIQPLALGEVGKDVVYTPIPPCRVFETRTAFGGAGPLPVGTPRTYNTVGDLSQNQQGGNAAGCGIPLGAAAVQLQMSPVFPTGFGWITGNAQGQPINPNAALFTYNTGDLNTTSIALVLNQTNGQFTIQANNTGTELVGDAVGYFIAPTAGNGLRVIQSSVPNAPNVINGSSANSVTAGVRGATIAGGGIPVGSTDPDFIAEAPNRVTDVYGTVGGGYGNRAGNDTGTVIDAPFATVSGGILNTASGSHSTVGGGASNTASGDFSSVVGGLLNTASGHLSFAAGRQAKTQTAGASPVPHNGTFVWADASGVDFNSSGDNQFLVRASGGMAVNGTPPNSAVELSVVSNGDEFANLFMRAAPDAGGILVSVGGASAATTNDAKVFIDQYTTGGAQTRLLTLTNAANPVADTVSGIARAQTFTSTSDRNVKTAFEALDAKSILARVVEMPVMSWAYKNEESIGVRHIGPVAQDFKRLFAIGYDDKSISSVDASGVALAAIQGLHRLVEEKDARIDKLERDLALIKRKLHVK